MAFSPDGTRLASGGADNTVRVWDAATGQPVGQPLTGHTDWVNSVAFSPDGHRIASGSADNTVRLWDAATGQPVGQPLTGHTDRGGQRGVQPRRAADRLRQLATTPCGVWDADTGQPIGQPLTGHTDRVYSVAFSPDGSQIASGGEDDTVRRVVGGIVWTRGVARRLVFQAHDEHQPPAMAGVGVARDRLHRSLSWPSDPGRWLNPTIRNRWPRGRSQNDAKLLAAVRLSIREQGGEPRSRRRRSRLRLPQRSTNCSTSAR